MWTISINSAINDGRTALYDESCSSTLASTFSNGRKRNPEAGVVSGGAGQRSAWLKTSLNAGLSKVVLVELSTLEEYPLLFFKNRHSELELGRKSFISVQWRVNLGPFRKFDEIRVQAWEAFMPRMLTRFDKNGGSAVAGSHLFNYFAGCPSVANRNRVILLKRSAWLFRRNIRVVARQDTIWFSGCF